MNSRVFQIIKNQSLIERQDLEVLQSEIMQYPYAQSLRAVQLIGIQKFNEDYFKNKLSEVAAYTADKKNLYKILHPQEGIAATVRTDKMEMEPNAEVAAEEILIDNDAQLSENHDDDVFQKEVVAEVFSKELMVDEMQENEQKQTGNGADISFHGVEDFLPRVKFSSTQVFENVLPPQKSISKADAEMQRLIAEVEARMKLKTSQKSEQDDDSGNHDAGLDFYENSIENPDVSQQNTEAVTLDLDHPLDDWKPMAFGNEEVSKTTISEDMLADVQPVKNDEETLEITAQPDENEGNVGRFINTWQTWLRLSKADQEIPSHSGALPDNPDKKAAAIENFIENEPRISKLRKEDLPPARKERGEDISHLMTETLAKIYTEQKLYTKAVEAYEVLKEKFPEKAAEFSKEIIRIKELRQSFK